MKRLDIGTELIVNIKDNAGNPIDLTTATSIKLVYKYGTTTIQKNCEIVEPATAGRVKYVVLEGDFPQAAVYQLELRIIFIDGDAFTSSRIALRVEDILS